MTEGEEFQSESISQETLRLFQRWCRLQKHFVTYSAFIICQSAELWKILYILNVAYADESFQLWAKGEIKPVWLQG